MKALLSLLSLWLLAPPATAQVLTAPAGLGYPAATAYSQRLPDAFSVYGNSAAPARLQRFSAGLFSERRFALQELSVHHLTLAHPAAGGAFALTAGYHGQALYNETALAIGYARPLGEAVAVGLRLGGFWQQAAGYGSAAAITVEGGLLLKLTDGLQAGLQAVNPHRGRLGRSGMERLPAAYTLGLGYDLSPQVTMQLAMQKTEGKAVGVDAGLQYILAEKFFARASVQSATATVWLGLGLRWKNLRLDVAASIHPQLGATPALLLLYQQAP